MGQKVNPIGFRVGITEPWSSTWYAPKAAYGAFLIEDHKLRKYIDRKLNRRPPFAAVARIDIERTREEVTITLRTARPGLVIGPKGAEVDKLREEIEDMIGRKVAPVKVIEIKNPDLNAQLVDDAGRRKRDQDRGRRAAWRCRNRPHRAGGRGVDPADDAPGERGLRVRAGVHDVRGDRREVLDLSRTLRRRDSGHGSAPRRRWPQTRTSLIEIANCKLIEVSDGIDAKKSEV